MNSNISTGLPRSNVGTPIPTTSSSNSNPNVQESTDEALYPNLSPPLQSSSLQSQDKQPMIHTYRDFASVPDQIGFVRKKKGGVNQPFPEKLMEMLMGGEDPYVVSWLPHGRSFLVHKPKEFTEQIMPKYFKQTKLTSFQRQLNLYGFRRITQGADAGSYYHELFLRCRPQLCMRMNRQKVKGIGHKQPTDASTEPNFYSMEVRPTSDDVDKCSSSTPSCSASSLDAANLLHSLHNLHTEQREEKMSLLGLAAASVVSSNCQPKQSPKLNSNRPTQNPFLLNHFSLSDGFPPATLLQSMTCAGAGKSQNLLAQHFPVGTYSSSGNPVQPSSSRPSPFVSSTQNLVQNEISSISREAMKKGLEMISSGIAMMQAAGMCQDVLKTGGMPSSFPTNSSAGRQPIPRDVSLSFAEALTRMNSQFGNETNDANGCTRSSDPSTDVLAAMAQIGSQLMTSELSTSKDSTTSITNNDDSSSFCDISSKDPNSMPDGKPST
mmetsp:Transcript_19707/g.44743  ORF Transcript_19707/g.44743 Transcript_19707/m.44743 type:complete len:493 (+) Transcript_19707:816-2294(+)|eukprot:CAMPEP_0113303390 /NCGR_PEP_ID=MMETSP0010_2-20120614/3828_1 /TAXON_ID=216773 ORGANISM="Corethron hystrix, Strain 308" /NCGR_SAMPLE_ID=MMETSP0010_2 /ASSEMBLY_ACC=CAM_ASM_000155 /LENGTH=492 /DNA_ID=CAMNT_0000157383 /DNA_START=811 /DNA_END=2289 /DNA_ORIENTATION=- /assembly_acc=CAM_ASM_000155